MKKSSNMPLQKLLKFSEVATQRCSRKQFLKYFWKNPLFVQDFKPSSPSKRFLLQKHRQKKNLKDTMMLA